MAKQRSIYARRRTLRALEKGWVALERTVNRLTTIGPKMTPYNPLYHLGTLTIFLLIILTLTGVFLTVFYRPGSDRAYLSVMGLSENWLGLLVRTIHRYASDAIIIVAFLHALKMLISDRFWGNRWFAWVSGWVMLALIWIMGLMGYWLVWDQSAQWLTEYFIAFAGGPFAHSILGSTDLAASSYALFVIVLFLHVFIPPVILIGVLIHVLRLARSRYWSPRWLMISTVMVLIMLALWWPAPLSGPADLSKLVGTIELDWLYMGFLPLVDTIGAPIFWGLSLLALLLAFVLPWLAKGQHDGPSIVIESNCTGCSACARECPYDAIEMVQRDDESPFESLAVVNPGKCTGCGICVGACHDDAIELDRLVSAVVRQDLQRTSAQASAAGQPPVTVYVCNRHAALGTLPPLEKPEPINSVGMSVGGSIPLLQAKLPPRVNVGQWRDDDDECRSVITAVIPCTGMLHPNWAAELIEAGSAGAIVVSCPVDDCSHREGPHWIADRLKRRRTFRAGHTHFLELPPGSKKEVRSVWAQMVGDLEQAAQVRQSATVVGSAGKKASEAAKPSWWGHLRYLGVGLVILLAVFLASMLVNQTATNPLPEQGQVRIVLNHGGQLLSTAANLDPEVAAKLPDNIDPSMVLGGERYPIGLRVAVDDEVMLERTYRPRGLRREGAIYEQEALWLEPGNYAVEIWLMDDDVEWRSVFAEMVDISDGNVNTLIFDNIEDQFVPQEE
ncbi:MAG: 4Fe-4S dicluster domain-containing protein [Chloroflexi bacterium]|nr:4Fe-4S dicluster domain-containing protein [Chloroflexota bacterium]